MAEIYPTIEKLERKFYKKLVTDVARELTEKEIKEVAFQHSIKEKDYKDALDLFLLLERRDIIGNSKPISELVQIFENIQRQDLAKKILETAVKMQGRVSQSLKLPEKERITSAKRSNTVSGVPLNEIQHPQQETQGLESYSPIVNKPLQDLSEQDDSAFTDTLPLSLPVVSSQASLLEAITHDHEKTPSYDGRSEASLPASGNRSRNISEHISPGQYQGSRSGTRSPSLLNTTSASGYHSISDLSAISQVIPQTEHERNFVLMTKFFELLQQKPSIAKRIVNESDPDPDEESANEDSLPALEENHSLLTKSPNPKLDMTSKRKSQTESERTLGSSLDSSNSNYEEIEREMAASPVSPLNPHKLRKTKSRKVSNLFKRLGRTRVTIENSSSVHWLVKRDQLNKIICRHQEYETINCKKKIEVDVGNGIFNPQLTLVLWPYGLEEDIRRYITLEVHINVPMKAPKLKASTNVKLVLTISKIRSEDKMITIEENLDLRVFYKKKFISHKELRESRSDIVEILAQAECIKPAV